MNDPQITSTPSSLSTELRFTDEQFIWRFSPNQTAPELLETIFTGRDDLLRNVIEKIAHSANSGATHHILLYGPRGIGKSHFIALLHHRLVTDPQLQTSLRIAWLNEDETTTSVVQFLVRIYRSLCKWYPTEFSAAWLDELLNQPPAEISTILVSRLVARFETKRLVILVENLNLLFEGIGEEGQHTLRAVLTNHPFACFVATSQQLFKSVTDRSEPFFGFFQQIPLKPLTFDDAQDLLVKIAQTKGQQDLVQFLQTPDGRGRVRAIHDLAGGNHRVYIVLSGFVTRESLDELLTPFRKMADDLTPYYQERLRWLSPLQRQIVELLCRQQTTLNPKEIARRLLTEQTSIGKQMRILEQIGYLSSRERGRETFYELSEPLMRLAYEVKEHSLLGMLVDFLRIWYRPDDFHKFRRAGLSQTTLAYVNAALERHQNSPDPRLHLLMQEIEQATADNKLQELGTLWEERAAASNSARDWFMAGYCFNEYNREYGKAVECYDKGLEIDPTSAAAWNNKGSSLNSLSRFEEALICYNKALEIDPRYAFAWNNKGNSLHRLGRFEEALICRDKALEIAPRDAVAWTNKGSSLHSLGRFEEALICRDKALEIDPRDAAAWCNKGSSLHSLGRFEEALICLDKSLEIAPRYAAAWNNKGNSLHSLGQYEEAQGCVDNALEIDPGDSYANFSRVEFLLSMQRWHEGFTALQQAFAQSRLENLGDVGSMLSSIFRCSEQEAQVESRFSSLLEIYRQAAIDYGFAQTSAAPKPPGKFRPSINPLLYLSEGLLKSLPSLAASQFAAARLEMYPKVVEACAAGLPEFEIALRLFRCGIQFLISGRESEFVKLIQPERRILRQALGLPEELP